MKCALFQTDCTKLCIVVSSGLIWQKVVKQSYLHATIECCVRVQVMFVSRRILTFAEFLRKSVYRYTKK